MMDALKLFLSSFIILFVIMAFFSGLFAVCFMLVTLSVPPMSDVYIVLRILVAVALFMSSIVATVKVVEG